MSTETKQQTCYALEACSEDQVIDIFQESFGYLSFVQKFVDRLNAEPIDYENDELASSEKPLLILDIDNTILFCRYFADEICVGDNITYYIDNNDDIGVRGIVQSIWYRLSLQLFDDDLIDEYETDLIEYDHCHHLSNRLKKKKQFIYPYKIDEKTNEIIESRQSLIKELRVIGCEIEYEYETEKIHKFISFEEDSTEIENFLPSLSRKGYDDAAFIYNGFMVRLRNGLEDFLEQMGESFDIVFFTAANKAIYEGLMIKLHEYLCDILGLDKDDDDDKVWKQILFRDDCSFDYDQNGKLFHHKDITKFNKDLSKVIIVDNSSLSYKLLEPNAILIKDYMGKDKPDNELEVVLELLEQIIDFDSENSKFVDFRYILTEISNDLSEIPNDLNQYDRRSPDDIFASTQRFLNDLKESLMKRAILPNTLNFCEPSLMNPNISNINVLELKPSSTDEIEEDDDGDDNIAANILDDNDNKDNKDNNDNDDISEKKTKKHHGHHTYSISLKLRDIPHFSIDFEMNNLPTITNEYEHDLIHDYNDCEYDDDDTTEDEEDEEDEEYESKQPMNNNQKNRRISFSMKPRPDVYDEQIASGASSVFLHQSVNKIIAYHANEKDNTSKQFDKNMLNEMHELKRKYSRPIPPAPPKKQKTIKRIDNPWVAKLKRHGTEKGDITLGGMMKKIPHRPAPPAPVRRHKLPPPPPPKPKTPKTPKQEPSKAQNNDDCTITEK